MKNPGGNRAGIMNIKIVSSTNARLKTARNLFSRAGIIKQGFFLIEGPRFISDCLERGNPEWVFLSETAGSPSRLVAERASKNNVDILELPAKLFAGISDTENSQGIVAVFPVPPADIDVTPRSGIFLLLDRIADPGNMGTIIRSAAAFGCTAVLTGKGSCFPFIPKVTRSAAGTNSFVPLISDVDLAAFMRDNSETMDFLGADPSGTDIQNIRPEAGCHGLVIGSEAHGISEEVNNHLSLKVAIPMAPGVESLNAGVSASILLYALSTAKNR